MKGRIYRDDPKREMKSALEINRIKCLIHAIRKYFVNKIVAVGFPSIILFRVFVAIYV